MKLSLSIGISNCGKSSWAESVVASCPNTINLSRDYFRYGKYADSELPHLVLEREITWDMFREFYQAIEEGKNIIISDSNLSHRSRDYWNMLAKRHNLELEYVIFHSAFTNIFNSKDVYLLPEHVTGKQYQMYTDFINSDPMCDVTYTVI